MLNWIVWNRTVYMDKNGFGIKYNGWYAIKQNKAKNLPIIYLSLYLSVCLYLFMSVFIPISLTLLKANCFLYIYLSIYLSQFIKI